jgi:hypothetical protein
MRGQNPGRLAIIHKPHSQHEVKSEVMVIQNLIRLKPSVFVDLDASVRKP